MKKTLTHLLLLPAIFWSTGLIAQQTLYNDGSLIHANRNALIHIDAQLENKDSSTFENDGVIELTSHFTNDSTAKFTTGIDGSSTERAVKFVGGGLQFIYGNMSDTVNHYFYNLVVDKSASGSAVSLHTNTTVKGSLVFGSATSGSATYTPTAASRLTDNSGKGLIRTYDTSAHDYELYISNSSVNAIKGYGALYINNATTDSFIQTRGAKSVGAGGLSRNVSQKGVDYIFPVGTAANGYNPANFNFSSLGTANGKVRGMFVDAAGGVGTLGNHCTGCGNSAPLVPGFDYYFPSNPCNNGTPQWVALNQLPVNHGYWSFDGDSTDKYTMETFPYYPAFSASSVDIWRMLKKNGSITAEPTGDWTPDITATVTNVSDLLTYSRNSGCYTGQGVMGGTYTGFANYQMAREKLGAGIALPVELISLTAENVGNKFIRIAWVTAQEIDNRGYSVMRSANGTDFSPVGWVGAQGGGNKTSRSDYSYDDQTAVPGIIYYYRLAQQDLDGVINDTYIVDATLTMTGSLSVSDCYPNPTSGNAKITILSTKASLFTLEIYNIAGQLIRHSDVSISAGESILDIHAEKLPAGLYDIVLRNAENTFTNKLSIIK
jgi:hypothetical protein